MIPNNIFTRQTRGLDNRVWHVIFTTIFLSLGFLSYRFIEVKKCTPVSFLIKTITVHTDSLYSVGEYLTFIASVNEDEVTWDFGDNSEKITGPYVTHKFQDTGTYFITATTGTTCQSTKKITIKPYEVLQPKDNSLVIGEEILGPFSTITGKEELFTCMVNAKTYEWTIPNYPKMIQTGSSARFRFPTSGKFRVQVTLDNDNKKRYIKEVAVEAAPSQQSQIPDNIVPLIPESVQPFPVPEKTLKISDAIFTGYLEKVIDKKMAASDFDTYLCDKGETKVISNGELLTFNAFCEEISGKKRRKLIIGKTKIKIKSAVMQRDNDGCVETIVVKYR